MTHAVFTPPVALGRPLHTNNQQHPAYALFRHYAPHAAGTNVWIVNDVVTTTQPVELDEDDSEFLGGHISVITAAEQALLTAAGYGAYITTIGDPVDTDPAPFVDNFFGGAHYGEGSYGGIG